MPTDHDCGVVGEMLLRRALHLDSADLNLDAANTLLHILDTPLLPHQEPPNIDLADHHAFKELRDRVAELLDGDLADCVGDLAPDNYRIDTHHPTNPNSRNIENFAPTLQAAQQWVQQQLNESTTRPPRTYVVVDLRTQHDIWHLTPTKN